ncbi:type IIL restriction-modification enzyme MmeI [Micromonospora sp. NPDC000668]|uniref:type IIL restriction-modification enzyme MmeI n=1 Tax=Micromonospora sp. NPDC000668 TaxID=3364219 RepID=UPI0036CC6C0E
MRSHEQIRAALVGFVARWQAYAGTERSEAETYLDELFECYGVSRKDRGAVFEDAHSSTGIVDLHLTAHLIVEMKAPKETTRLVQHRKDALEHWRDWTSVTTRRRPQFIMLCSFHRFEIWAPDAYPKAPLCDFPLAELPDRSESLWMLPGISFVQAQHPPDKAQRITLNEGKCQQGPSPMGKGFILTTEEARSLLDRTDASYPDVVRPYLMGDDIADDPAQRPRRWIIDFGLRPLEEAMRYPAALEILRDRVKPIRDNDRRKDRREKWWQFGKDHGLRVRWYYLPRYIAVHVRDTRLLTTWCEPWTCPSNQIVTITLDDDYSMGILSSFTHGAWAWFQSSTVKDDLRYAPTSTFLTFPWPSPVTDDQRARVAEAGRRVIARRQEICAEQQFGLTRLYDLVDEGAYADLRKLHRELDEAVAACYGWPTAIAQDKDEIGRRLFALNVEIARGRGYDPFAWQAGDASAEQLGFPAV